MSTKNVTWYLGAPDPEMERVEAVLRALGEDVAYATRMGKRVNPGSAYSADPHTLDGDIIAVECGWWDGYQQPIARYDHHRPDDPGYGRPPEEFLWASSIGQVIERLAANRDLSPLGWERVTECHIPSWITQHSDGSWCITDAASKAWRIPEDIVLSAAADHCLAAAYAGQCQGVDPDTLMHWRARTRAAFQKRSVEEVLADIERARQVLGYAELLRFTTPDSCGVCTGCGVQVYPADPDGEGDWDYCSCPEAVDMRGQHVPELPEASARDGVCFVADGLPDRDGRVKVVCQSGSPEQIEAFLRWAAHEGLIDAYGDPARGFAGAYRQQA